MRSARNRSQYYDQRHCFSFFSLNANVCCSRMPRDRCGISYLRACDVSPVISGCASVTEAPSLARTSTQRYGASRQKHRSTGSQRSTLRSVLLPKSWGSTTSAGCADSTAIRRWGSPSVRHIRRSGSYKEVYPGATDTVVTSINNTDVFAGWYQDSKGGIFGFTQWEGIWTKYQDNHLLHEPQYTELLGLSDDDLAVGFYRLSGIDHSFELNLTTGKFQSI